MKILTHFSRIFVGILFIISGLIKLNDPVGFSYKLQEYFSAEVLNLEFLIPFSLGIALFVVIFEVVLGVMLLIGFKPKFTMWSLLLMIVFFTFLTFYSAYFNKVTDCGCFGDALKLTPWQSFTKDVILLVFILILFFNIKLIKPFFKEAGVTLIVFASYTLCLVFAYYVLNHLPLIDFRAYKTGTNIQSAMTVPEGAPKSVYEMVFIYKINGVEKEFTEKEINNVPEGAEFVDRKDKLITQGYVPPIHDFSIEKDGTDYTEEMLNTPKLILIISYDLEKAREKGLAKAEVFAKTAEAKGYKVIGMTASTPQTIEKIKKENNLTFDYYFCDATALKTIERSNPSIVVLEKGTIVDKKHWNDIDQIILK
ncbi:BT_3928 family protein [Flavobacterium kingsejongi]|uniref:DoxX family protein n=1 Tax=Flavobacterium kingsejongi TaxID=1678728 RepID=A0A2S1LSL8_9FLAO|nr:BT_3928 family protein [Flavobacterium kingsejongi]AWG26714.1 DoxX family protein [Flavobacterium kingsejongi]